MHHIFNDSLSASDLCKQVRLSKELNPPPSTHTLKGALIRPPRYWSSGVLQGAFSNRIPGSRWLCSASMETSHSSTPPTLCQQLRAGAHERTHTHTHTHTHGNALCSGVHLTCSLFTPPVLSLNPDMFYFTRSQTSFSARSLIQCK